MNLYLLIPRLHGHMGPGQHGTVMRTVLKQPRWPAFTRPNYNRAKYDCNIDYEEETSSTCVT